MRQCHRDPQFREATQECTEEDVLESYTDGVFDVVWAPNIGLSRSCIVTAAQVRLPSVFPATSRFPDVVWRVSWSLAGNILAVSCGDGKVTLWKENLKGVWECVSDMTS